MNLQEVIEELRSLNEPVPIPPRLPTEQEVSDAEHSLGRHLPSDYRYFLLHGSDIVYGAIEPACVTPGSGHLDLVEMATEAWELGIPKEMLPFCEDNGDYYCIKPDGQVVFWSHNRATAESWPNLATWIKQVWMEEEDEEDD